MAKTEIKHPDKQVSTGAYSAGIAMDGWLYVSGHAAEDLRTGEPVGETVADQTRAALRNVGKVLEAAGASFADVVKCTCYLSNIDDFAEFNAAYAEFFPKPMPARSTVGAGLPAPLKVEIDAIARVPQKGSNA